MSAVMKPRRHPQRDAAEKRFAEFASARTVSAELGISYNTVYPWWRDFNKRPIPRKAKPPREYAREMALSSDSDPADEAQ